jgi:hypothetical protein
MVWNAVTAGAVGLVDVNTLNGASKNWRWRSGRVGRISCWLLAVGCLTTDGVVEDEDFGGASTVERLELEEQT